MATDKEKKEQEKEDKEFAATCLKNGVPTPQIALYITLAELIGDITPDEVKETHDRHTKLVQAAFREL
jgi:hypothetical protein